MLVLEAWIVTFGERLVENARFGSLDCHFWWEACGKCSFWKLGLSLFVKGSWKMLVLEAWIVAFGERLVENARFGSLDCHFWWKARGKCSFWKLGLSLLVKGSWKTLVLKPWIVTFGERLVENARFGSLDCHFLVKGSWKMLIVTFGERLVENARFGSLDCHFWWKARGKRSFWNLGLSLLVKGSWKMLVLKPWIVTFGERLLENARFGSLDCHFLWKARGKCSFWKLGLSLLVKGSRKMLVLEAWIATFGEILVENARFGSLDSRFLVKGFWKMLVLEAWIVAFGERLVENARLQASLVVSTKGAKKECQERVSSKSVQQECLARVSCQECPARVSSKECPAKSVQQECPARDLSRVSSRSVQQRVPSKGVLLRVSCRSVKKECLARVSLQECQRRVSRKGVKEECLARVSSKSV